MNQIVETIKTSHQELLGKQLMVGESAPDLKADRTLYLKKLSCRTRESDIVAYFNSLGVEVKAVRWALDPIDQSSAAVVEFTSEKDAEVALKDSRNREFGGTEISWAENVLGQSLAAKEPNVPRTFAQRNERTICVTNLEDVQESVLLDVFGSCGEVTAIEQAMDPTNAEKFTGCAFVTYKQEEEAALAIAQLTGIKLLGRGQPIEITRAVDCHVKEPIRARSLSSPPHCHGNRDKKKKYRGRYEMASQEPSARETLSPQREGSPPSSLEGHRSLSLKKRILKQVVADNHFSTPPSGNPVKQEEECAWLYNENDTDFLSVASSSHSVESDRDEESSNEEASVHSDSEDSESIRGGESSWEPSEDGKDEQHDEDRETEVLMMCQKIVDEYDRPDQVDTAVAYLLDTLRNTRRTRPEVPKRCRYPDNYADIFRKLGMIQDPKNSAHYHCWQLPPQGSVQRAFMDEIRAEGRMKKTGQKTKIEKPDLKVARPMNKDVAEHAEKKRRGRKRKSEVKEAKEDSNYIQSSRERKRLRSLSSMQKNDATKKRVGRPKRKLEEEPVKVRRGPGRPPKRERRDMWAEEDEEEEEEDSLEVGKRGTKNRREEDLDECYLDSDDMEFLASSGDEQEEEEYKESPKPMNGTNGISNIRKRGRPRLVVEKKGGETAEVVNNVATIEKELGQMMQEINQKMQALQQKQHEVLQMKEKMRLLQC